MADIKKPIDYNVSPNERYQVFTKADATTGDVLKVNDSLGFPASYVSIAAQGGAMAVRFNVYRRIYQLRPDDGIHMNHVQNTSSGFTIKEATASYSIESNTTFELSNKMPISDIELIVVSGNYKIFVS